MVAGEQRGRRRIGLFALLGATVALVYAKDKDPSGTLDEIRTRRVLVTHEGGVAARIGERGLVFLAPDTASRLELSSRPEIAIGPQERGRYLDEPILIGLGQSQRPLVRLRPPGLTTRWHTAYLFTTVLGFWDPAKPRTMRIGVRTSNGRFYRRGDLKGKPADLVWLDQDD